MPATSAWVKAAFVFFSFAFTGCEMPEAVSRTSRCAGESQKFFRGSLSVRTSLMMTRALLTSSAIVAVVPESSLAFPESLGLRFFGVFIVSVSLVSFPVPASTQSQIRRPCGCYSPSRRKLGGSKAEMNHPTHGSSSCSCSGNSSSSDTPS